MFENVRNGLKELIKISDECPDKYQIKCFEVLLQALVREEPFQGKSYERADIKVAEKVPYFSQYGIKQEEWQGVFHNDGSEFRIIVKDLKEKTSAKKQLKLALLLGIKGLLDKKEAYFEKESLMDICKNYSALDPKNFSSNMKRNKNLFLQKDGGWTLTIPGQQEAANVIKELV